MALKDWKKEIKNNQIYFWRKTTIPYKYIRIYSFLDYNKRCWMVDYSWLRNSQNKVVKTKSQALKFARAYMRKH